MKKITAQFLVIIFFVQFSFAQQASDEQIINQIKTEAMEKSQVMETLSYLTDVFGARLTSSPNIKAAQNWTREKLTSWGLKNANIEPWGEFGKGWAVERFSAELIAPTYDRLTVYPLAWSPSTNGVISGTPTVVSIRSKADFDKYRGKLKGAIVFRGTFALNKPKEREGNPVKRFSDEELDKYAKETNAAADGTTDYWAEEKDWLASLERAKEIYSFLKNEGIAALVEPSRFPNNVLLAQGFYDTNGENNVPAFVMAREQYGRIVRLSEKNIPVKVELNLQTKFYDDKTGANVVAEIPGTDPKLKDEVVLLGGHFDSWHSGTGATDNAAGCVVMMEALRIIQKLGLKPRRTIRVALWDGEEQDYYGSMGYVKKHYGDPKTLQLKPEHEKLAAYYNLDNGSGKIRGVYLQGNTAVKPIFENFLKPFSANGAGTLTIMNTGGTDHMSFDSVGLSGFEFIQDPLDYETRVHHSNLDTLEAVNEEDLKFNAAVVATFAYLTAQRDEKLPRKTLPKPQ
jgi:Zn-dependent M28 family amino/carboxypeptidase